MSTHLEWSDIAIRLACTVVAGALIGWNRGEHGHAAGLRTTLLVSLAACLTMLQVNLLLSLTGKSPDSFVTADPLRLPLGLLSGMGFIGGGAIVRRDNLVTGVTTAATLWFVTVLGLVFGGGFILLGLVSLAIGMIVLVGLKYVEKRMKYDHPATLSIVTGSSGPSEVDVRTSLLTAGLRIRSLAFSSGKDPRNLEWNCSVLWRTRADISNVPDVVYAIAGRPGVVRIAWTPQSR